MSYLNKMMQMKKMLKKSEEVVEERAFQKPAEPHYVAEWQQVGLEPVRNDFGLLFQRQVHYPFHYEHGKYRLDELFDVLTRWESYESHPYKATDETLLFFDTETTGLKGAGTHIFLLGFLKKEATCFTLTQYVLADPSNEAAFLYESKLWQQQGLIVSYNGKSFDWPQLEVRWTLNRAHIPPLQMHTQMDLLHSTKRLWKNDLAQMKLTKVEEEKLAFHRIDDIPGFLAPIIYNDAVKSGDPTSLMKVLKHNEWDLLSLITLYIHTCKLLFEELEESSVTYTNIGKWHTDLKEYAKSERVLTKVTEQFDDQQAALAYYYLAFQQKKAGRYEEAVASFQKSLPGVEPRYQKNVCEQLAKLYEHQLKNPEQALFYARLTFQMIDQIVTWQEDKKEKERLDVKKRQERLLKKLEQRRI